uniref:Uncharacterized protein n=1 Tax=Nelumbo nucifera TaxID=4432 RepID=A0A822ZMT4_NELNU|nr:TPA_asm: hypothetical protein HUJ06_016469 [Nelumbo nucifera]
MSTINYIDNRCIYYISLSPPLLLLLLLLSLFFFSPNNRWLSIGGIRANPDGRSPSPLPPPTGFDWRNLEAD